MSPDNERTRKGSCQGQGSHISKDLSRPRARVPWSKPRARLKKEAATRAAFKSREETPKEGICGEHTALHNLMVRRTNVKRFLADLRFE